MVQMLVGLIIGAAISSAVWWFFMRGFKAREENSKKERDDMMRSVGALMAEIDSIISSYNEKNIDTSSKNYSTKLETINKIMKTNLHLFDIYYVKYIELLLRYYNYRAKKVGILNNMQKPVSEIEMETSFSFIDNEIEVAPKEVTEEKKGEEISLYEKTIPIRKEEERVENLEDREPNKEREEQDSSVDTFNKIEEFEFEKVDSLSKKENVEKQPEKISEKEEEVELLETLNIIEKEEEGTSEPEVESSLFEEQEEREEDKTKLIEREKIFSDSEDDKLQEKLEEVSKEEVYLNLSKNEQASQFNEEEFALETLIDVDASSILSSPKSFEEKENNKIIDEEKHAVVEQKVTKEDNTLEVLPSSSEEDMEVVISSDVKHIKKNKQEESPQSNEAEKKLDSGIPANTSEKASKVDDYASKGSVEVREASDEEEFVIEVNSKPKSDTKEATTSSQHITATSDSLTNFKLEEMITGDDIVNKIASWDEASFAPKERGEKKTKEEENVLRKSKSEISTQEKIKKVHSENITKDSFFVENKENKDKEITGDDVVNKIDSFFGLIKD